MVSELVKKLRTADTKDRKAYAMELAMSGSNEAVKELKGMAKAKRRHLLRWYAPDDQLVALESLGETGNRKALKYLKSLLSTCKITDAWWYGRMPRYSEQIGRQDIYCSVRYTGVGLGLRGKIHGEVHKFWYSPTRHNENPFGDLERETRNMVHKGEKLPDKYSSPYYKALYASIQKLSSALSLEDSNI